MKKHIRANHKTEPNKNQIHPDAELGLAILVAEDEEGHYEPVAVVATLGEAQELADSDLADRRSLLERGEDPLCPDRYTLWAMGRDGYQMLHEIRL